MARDSAAGLCARLLRQWRGSATQQAWATRYGVSRQSVGQWEAGVSVPPVHVVHRMASDVDSASDHMALVFGRLAAWSEAR